MKGKGRMTALLLTAAVAATAVYIPAAAEGENSITVSNGISASAPSAEAGATVTLTLPEDYVDGSLVISYVNSDGQTEIPSDITMVSETEYSFTMPDYEVSVSCLENDDPSKMIVVGTTSTYYVRSDNELTVTFDVPDAPEGYIYTGTEVNVPVRDHAYNALDMTATMNGEPYTIEGGVVSGTGTAVSMGENILTITNEHQNGVDYYHSSKGHYPVDAGDLATLTLTFADENSRRVWDTYRENTFTGENPDYSIAWKITNNANDRKGASHTVDTENRVMTITSSEGAETALDGDNNAVLYGVTAAIKNVQPNTKYTLTFKEKTNMTKHVSNGVYINAITLATMANSTDPDATKDTDVLNSGKLADLHTSLTDDEDWCERTVEYVSGSGLPDGYDSYEVKFTFMLRGCTGAVQIKDLTITGAAAPEPTPTPSPVPAPTKDPEKDYTPPVHTGDVIDPLDTDDTFQYHFAGGTDDYMNGVTETGKTYDVYMWVPQTATPETLRGLVAIKMNLIEVPFANSAKLREALAKENFGILFIVDQNDAVPEGKSGYNYKNILQGMYTAEDYKGDDLFGEKWRTWDGKDAAQIMDDIMKGIADASGYECVAENTPVITIGHSAASPFGYRSGNWAYDRVIAQIDMKNGMWGDATDGSTAEGDEHGYGMVPGIPSLQLAAQYTEHATGAGRDRSVCDARYHIDHQRAVDPDYLVSHIIEWGSGHYDWSNNATDIMIAYIEKAIEYRLNKNEDGSDKGFTGGNDEYTLTDLTDTGYLMKPFEKDGDGAERPAGYYRDELHGWLSSGQENSTASEEDKKASFWFFDEELANEINAFTNYAIPESPGRNDTGVEGKTHSDYEPYMLIKNPANSVYADTVYDFNSYISPFTNFNGSMSRYGDNRFINYEKMESPSAGNGDDNPWLGATNTGNLRGYDTVTVDTYYMSEVPSITTTNGEAYDGVGDKAAVPEGVKAEVVPLIAPYELIESELIDADGMTRDGSELAGQVASVTRSTLRFHNNRVYYNSGCKYTNEAGTKQGAFSMIYSPEAWNGGELVSTFKSTGIGMNVPYVDTGKGTDQILTLEEIEDIDVKGLTENPRIAVEYTSSDSDLQKYTDVFVNYGPAKAVRTVDPEDGSYSWEIEILLDEIPEGAEYPIEVNIVASNLGKWEKVSGATDEISFDIVKTAEPTATATAEPTPTATATAEPTPTATATAEPTPTATATEEPTATATAEPTPTATATAEPAPTEPAAKADGITIGGETYTDKLPESGELTAVTITKDADADLDGCTAYAAIYSEGRLIGIRLVRIENSAGEEQLTLAIDDPMDISECDELKILVWNDNMKSEASMLTAEK